MSTIRQSKGPSVTKGAQHVRDAPGGQYAEAFLTAVHTGTPAGAAQIWSPTIGADAIQVTLLTPVTSGKVFVLGYSETAADSAAVIARIDAAITASATPDGAEHVGLFTLAAQDLGQSIVIYATDKIRTVVAECNEAAAGINYVLRLVRN